MEIQLFQHHLLKKNAMLSPLDCFCIFVKNYLSINVLIYFLAVCHVLLTYFSIFTQLTSHSLTTLALSKVLKSGNRSPLICIVLCQIYFGYSMSFAFPYKFQYQLSISNKFSCIFNRDCVESII